MEKAPSGLSEKGTERLANLAALRRFLEQELVGLELPDDDRDGLRRKSGEPCDLGLGQAAVAADQRQRQALVVEAHPALVGAAGQASAPLPKTCAATCPIHRHARPPVPNVA